MQITEEIVRSRDISRRALEHIAQAVMPPTPRNYELFYSYVAGNKPLSAAMAHAVSARETLSDAIVDGYLDSFVPVRGRIAAEAETVGAQMSEELAAVAKVIRGAAESTGDFGQALDSLSQQITKISTPTQLKFIVTTIVDKTAQIARNSKALESRLNESKKQIDDLHHRLETTRAEALTDELTGLSNRKRLDQILEMEIGEAQETGEALCLIVADIDHFKRFNDTYGHQTGDQVLRLVAQTIKTNVKGRDHAGRFGGEEFAVVLPKTSLRDAVVVAEQLRLAVRSRELVKKSTGEVLGHITLSLGVAEFRAGETAEKLFSRADQSLYAAKGAGRDQVRSDLNADKSDAA